MTDTSEMSRPQEQGEREKEPLAMRAPGQVRSRVNWLIWNRLSGKNPGAIAARAQLRSALGKSVGAVPSIWSLTMDPDPKTVAGDGATRGELAVHTALTLYALHQGSHSESMHRTGHTSSLGAAVRVVASRNRGDRDNDEDHPIYRRFTALVAAPTFDALSTHARGLVDLLSSSEIALDYGQFAADLVNWQDPASRLSVLRRWGRDFARVPAQPESSNESSSN